MRHLRKGEVLIGIGEVPSAIYILISGVMRSFMIDAAGRDSTDCLVGSPGDIVMPAANITEPSPVIVEAVTEADLLLIDLQCACDLLKTDLGTNRLYNALLQEAWKRQLDVKRVVCQGRAKDRYRWFMREYPELVDAVPNRYIATFLGMTPVSLSRLRSQMREEDGAPS